MGRKVRNINGKEGNAYLLKGRFGISTGRKVINMYGKEGDNGKLKVKEMGFPFLLNTPMWKMRTQHDAGSWKRLYFKYTETCKCQLCSTPLHTKLSYRVFHKKCTVINTKLVNILITSLIIQGKLLPKLTLAPFITALSVRIGSCVIVGANVPCNWDI